MASESKGHRRVLFLTYNFPPKVGGMEQVALYSWEKLRQRAEVKTLAQFGHHSIDDSHDIRRAPSDNLLSYFTFLYRAGRQIVREFRPDIVVSTSALTALPTIHLARYAGAESVVIIHGLDTIYASRIYQWAFRYALPKIDRVIPNSHATRDEAVARGVAMANTTIVHPGCDAESFQRPHDVKGLRSRWALDNAKVISIPGRLVKRKGVDRFIRECLPRIVREMPEVKLLLAGGNPVGALVHTQDMEVEVAQAIQDAGMKNHVVLTGRLSQEEMIASFHVSDVVVLPVVPTPGDMEGFGIVLLEAGAAGKPVVATRLGGVPDAVVDGVTGTLVEAEEYDAMADALLDFLRDEEKSRRFGEAGRTRSLNELSWDVCAKRYADAILGHECEK